MELNFIVTATAAPYITTTATSGLVLSFYYCYLSLFYTFSPFHWLPVINNFFLSSVFIN